MSETIEMTPEQAKREALADEYEQEIAPVRDARSAAIEDHEKVFAEKWGGLQNDIVKVRGEVVEKLSKDGVPEPQHGRVVAMETAKLIEQYEAEKHTAALKLDKELPAPKKWVDFLTEKSASGDPTVLDLLEEAKRAPEAAIEGISDGKPRGIYLADLRFKADKDVVKYLRGKDEIIMDRGHRLDVKRLDDRDISAALQIAAQKFDMDKGLLLSGDHAFRVRSAELAGRLGYKVQNMSPEMQKAWDRGQATVAVLKQPARPTLDNNISGDVKKPDNIVLKVDQRIDIQKLLESNNGLKAGPSVNSLLMGPEQYMGAMDAWRNSDMKTLDALSHADINRPDGGLNINEIATEAPEMVDGEALSELAKELVLVRDAKILESRELSKTPEIYKTSQDRAAENEKQLLVRNINDQDQDKQKEQKAQKAHEKHDPYAFLLKDEKAKDVKAELIDKAKDVAIDQAMNAAGAPSLGSPSQPDHEMDMGPGIGF